MGKARFGLAWGFIFAVAAYDVYFAWQYRSAFHTWEMNPLARWLAALYGIEAVFGCKVLLLGFATVVGVHCYRCRHWLATPYTAFVSGVHLLLSLQYLVAQLHAG